MAQGPDSSVGEVPVGSCPDEVHMEEDGVKVQVQAEEEEIGETHGREQGEEKRREQTIKSLTWMTMRMRRSVHQHLSQCGVTHHSARALCWRKIDVCGVLFTQEERVNYTTESRSCCGARVVRALFRLNMSGIAQRVHIPSLRTVQHATHTHLAATAPSKLDSREGCLHWWRVPLENLKFWFDVQRHAGSDAEGSSAVELFRKLFGVLRRIQSCKQLGRDMELTLMNVSAEQAFSLIELHEHLNSSHFPGSFGTFQNEAGMRLSSRITSWSEAGERLRTRVTSWSGKTCTAGTDSALRLVCPGRGNFGGSHWCHQLSHCKNESPRSLMCLSNVGSLVSSDERAWITLVSITGLTVLSEETDSL